MALILLPVLRARMNRSAVVEGNTAAGVELKDLMALPMAQRRGITYRGEWGIGSGQGGHSQRCSGVALPTEVSGAGHWGQDWGFGGPSAG